MTALKFLFAFYMKAIWAITTGTSNLIIWLDNAAPKGFIQEFINGITITISGIALLLSTIIMICALCDATDSDIEASRFCAKIIVLSPIWSLLVHLCSAGFVFLLYWPIKLLVLNIEYVPVFLLGSIIAYAFVPELVKWIKGKER